MMNVDIQKELNELKNNDEKNVKTSKNNDEKIEKETDDIEIKKEKEKLFDDVNLSHKSLKRLLQNGYSKMDN
ncbi:MAG: hypothetical protein ACLFNW_02655 [Desulfobacterales bacterium]